MGTTTWNQQKSIPLMKIYGSQASIRQLSNVQMLRFALKLFRFKSGPDLLDFCAYGSMLTSSDGVILLGCQFNEEVIYQMKPNSNGDFVWSKMNQTLKFPRISTIVDYIDDDQVNCNYSWIIKICISYTLRKTSFNKNVSWIRGKHQGMYIKHEWFDEWMNYSKSIVGTFSKSIF